MFIYKNILVEKMYTMFKKLIRGSYETETWTCLKNVHIFVLRTCKAERERTYENRKNKLAEWSTFDPNLACPRGGPQPSWSQRAHCLCGASVPDRLRRCKGAPSLGAVSLRAYLTMGSLVQPKIAGPESEMMARLPGWARYLQKQHLAEKPGTRSDGLPGLLAYPGSDLFFCTVVRVSSVRPNSARTVEGISSSG
jgi:hypothetical protein